MKLSIFGRKSQGAAQLPARAATTSLFDFVHGQINREDVVADIWKSYQKLDDNFEKNISQLVPLYLQIERFVCKNKPFVVKQEFTKESLRLAIKVQVRISDLPVELAILFLPPEQESPSFFCLASASLARAIANHLGDLRLKKLLDEVFENTPVVGLYADGRLQLQIKDQQATVDWSPLLRRLYAVLIDEIVQIFGQKSAEDQIKAAYLYVRDTYGAEKLAELFEYIPERYLINERLVYLSREELASKVYQATEEERRKKEEAEDLAKKLNEKIAQADAQYKSIEDTKKAMINLLEDSRHLEGQLKNERDRAQTILANMSEGIFVIDSVYKIQIVNAAAEHLIGMPAAEIIGKDFTDITRIFRGDIELKVDERPVGKTLRSGEPVQAGLADGYSMHVNSRVIPVSTSAVPLKRDSKIVGAVVTFHDITREKEITATIEKTVIERTAELSEKNLSLEQARKEVSAGWEQQRREKARLVASINSLTLGFILTDTGNGILTMNPAAISLLDLPPTTTEMNEVEKVFAGTHVDLAKERDIVKNERKPRAIPHVLVGQKYFHIIIAPIMLEGKQDLIGTAIIIVDTTEERMLQRSRDEFFSIASHELRTPLTAIRGNTSMIHDYYYDQLPDPTIKEMIDDIHTSSVRLIGIVNDFLNMSRLEQKKLEFKIDPFDMVKVATDIIREYQSAGMQPGVTLSFVPPQGLPQALGDHDRVKEVLINLVGNALKFTKLGEVKIDIKVEADKVLVEVSDSGRGMSEANQQLLFHKFQQASDSILTRDATKGTGLGLYISKLMMEGMGGGIWLARSEIDKGSTFVFSLPVVK